MHREPRQQPQQSEASYPLPQHASGTHEVPVQNRQNVQAALHAEIGTPPLDTQPHQHELRQQQVNDRLLSEVLKLNEVRQLKDRIDALENQVKHKDAELADQKEWIRRAEAYATQYRERYTQVRLTADRLENDLRDKSLQVAHLTANLVNSSPEAMSRAAFDSAVVARVTELGDKLRHDMEQARLNELRELGNLHDQALRDEHEKLVNEQCSLQNLVEKYMPLRMLNLIIEATEECFSGKGARKLREVT